jgi:dTDP-4-amino-4,6-dideoxygalactose transaminase/lipopolysaccharide/colanic/teichoic acid biosynthesis glycosyltransferase
MIKRLFDFVSAFLGIIVLFPLFLIVSFLIKITSKGPIFYTQKRAGRHAKLFTIIKFRSMVDNHGDSNTVTVKGDVRITKFGAFIRKYKIDELPALWNVLIGEMSLVGPRPDLPDYLLLLQGEDKKILNLRPGITGPASLKYANEEQILMHQDDPETYHYEVIFKDKVKINLDYYYNRNLLVDLKLIFATIFRASFSSDYLLRIRLAAPDISVQELEVIRKGFSIDWVSSFGPHISKFENNLSEMSEGRKIAALSSGTSAIHLALILLGVKKNDDIICASFTFSASANPIKYLGANPIFIDSEKDSWNMCPALMEQAINDGISDNKKPKAIVLVHLYGMPAKLDEIMRIADNYDIPVIEDAAEALGSKYNNQQLGTFGKLGVYSFNGNKIITTSGGGALVCDDAEIINRAKFLATQARDEAPHYEHSQIGYNYRMSNVCAAIGLGQLEVLSDRVRRKREIYNFYKTELSGIKEIAFLDESVGSFSNYWLTTILIDENSAIDREQLRLHLEKDNIESRPLWKPMHLQPVFKSCKAYVNGVSGDLFNRGLCLPSGTNMTEKDLRRIVGGIKKLYEV